MRFKDFKIIEGNRRQKAADQVTGKEPTPKATPGRTEHPFRGRLVGESNLNEAARIQHAEDIIFWEGSAGAMRALEAIKGLEGDGHQAVTLKWDGSPAIIFGRDENGGFVLTDKSGFTAKGYDGRSKSPDDLEQMFLNRSGGKNRDNPGYVAFAGRMKSIFPLFEAAVPQDYRGYFKGDLLYFTTPKTKNGNYIFKPNIVEYAVDMNSELGKRIGASTTGVVIHREVDSAGNEGPLQSTDIFQGNDVLVVPPVSVERPADVNNKEIAQLEQLIKKNAAGIDELLNAQSLKAKQMSDFATILYTYTNSKVDTGLDNLGADFASWLEHRPQISDAKKAKVLQYVNENINAFNALWQTVSELMRVKDDIIKQFDSHDQTVKSNIPGHGEGGEGYVLAHPEGDIKLVPRATFTRANRAVER
tara:strand:+ start:1572 stop:2822 length:1251 start_codon:yes stop_codon:yes gene_type:complete